MYFQGFRLSVIRRLSCEKLLNLVMTFIFCKSEKKDSESVWPFPVTLLRVYGSWQLLSNSVENTSFAKTAPRGQQVNTS